MVFLIHQVTSRAAVSHTVCHLLPSSNSLPAVRLERYLRLVQVVIRLPVTVESHVRSHVGFAVGRIAL